MEHIINMKKLLTILLLILSVSAMGQGNFYMTHRGGNNEFDCGDVIIYEGGQSYPTEIQIDLGTSTGTVTFTYDAFSRPDAFQVFFDSTKVIDLTFRGNTI
jgi:hypothetical protein